MSVEVVFNEVQREEMCWYFSPDNHEGEPWPVDEPITIEVDRGQLVLNGVYLHSDGTWATFHEQDGP